MQVKQIREQIKLQTSHHSRGFQSVGVSAQQLNLDPILNIDLFHMSQPTFPPHPHAGFSAVTYLLPESQGAFQNRDSLGDQSLITPGSIHWTQAGSGVMHEEIPSPAGVDVWGFQIFVNLKLEFQLKPPQILHVDSALVPVVEYEAGRVRVVAGSHADTVSRLNRLDTQVDFLDVQVYPQSTLALSLEHPYVYFAFGIGGKGHLAEHRFGAHQVATLTPEGNRLILSAQEEGLRLLIGGGMPLQQAVYWDGPFGMSSRADSLNAKQRFLKGEMGHLSPSF